MVSIYEHITRRIHTLGYTDFKVQPLSLSLSAEEQQKVPAYNEWYFLISALQGNLRMIADNRAIDLSPQENSLCLNAFLDFTGLIEIHNSDRPQSLQFLKVIPQ